MKGSHLPNTERRAGDLMNKVESYIDQRWDLCIRECREDKGTLIGLPYPYTVPAVGHFEEMYYWDTYFTNKGLEIAGRHEQARNNTDNMLYLVKRYGFMPNGNRTYYLGKSQPPFLSLMVSDVYSHYQEKEWLKGAYEALKTEYAFWMGKRCAEMGLNFYDSSLWITSPGEVMKEYAERLGYMPQGNGAAHARHFAATCESGWDVSPRWGNEAYNYASVDLNSLLYILERNMSRFAGELENGEAQTWENRAADRKEKMFRYMDDGSGILLDYNFVTDSLSDIFSAASLYPMFAGLAEQKHGEALVEKLHLLETDYGILTCARNQAGGNYQWDYPNGWACLQYIAMVALDRYGYRREARRIADKFVKLVDRVYEETGNIWEKYNVVDGNICVKNEYDMPAMMGWTAGVYLCARKYLEENLG